ncbi:hypothetical protein CK203_049144 [Vitis vinifera]|uniref:Uncharacterized protein n=1 Tax=Vitis vinifera TaxID=29760 RepID=A0A438GV95_VITVI|nr:hypothetical protein CK203_049144 [Vitis vinifera]
MISNIRMDFMCNVFVENFRVSQHSIECAWHCVGAIWADKCIETRVEKRFSVLHISNIILAIGSILHHSSLQRLDIGDYNDGSNFL